jgi:hypothetical protein
MQKTVKGVNGNSRLLFCRVCYETSLKTNFKINTQLPIKIWKQNKLSCMSLISMFTHCCENIRSDTRVVVVHPRLIVSIHLPRRSLVCGNHLPRRRCLVCGNHLPRRRRLVRGNHLPRRRRLVCGNHLPRCRSLVYGNHRPRCRSLVCGIDDIRVSKVAE